MPGSRRGWDSKYNGTKLRAANNQNNRQATSMVAMMRQAGKNFSEIARELNSAGFWTAQGSSFLTMQVKRLAKQLAT